MSDREVATWCGSVPGNFIFSPKTKSFNYVEFCCILVDVLLSVN